MNRSRDWLAEPIEVKKTRADLSLDEQSVELLSRIVKIMEMWKFTSMYIAIILTAWLVLKLTGVI